MSTSDLSFRKILLLLSTFIFIVFNLSYGTEIPVHKVTQAAKIELPAFSIEKVIITGPDHELSWYATVKNLGETIPKNQTEITGYQLIGTKTIAAAGEKFVWSKKFNAKSKIQFARQKWSKAKNATSLKVIIKNKQNGKSVYKIVSFPKQKNGKPAKSPNSAVQKEHADILSKMPKLKFVNARYKGRGSFEVKIKNTGERGFMPNEIEIRPIYKIHNKLPVIGKVVTNRSGISVGKTKTVFSSYPNIYANGMSECWFLQQIVFEITDKVTGKRIEHVLNISKPDGEILNIDMENSKVTYFVKNTGSFTTKYYIKTDRLTLYKWDTTPVSNLPNYHYPKNIIMDIEDLFETSITLKSGETGSVSIDKKRVHAEIKQQFTSMEKNKFYMAAHFWVSLYNKFDASCNSKKRYNQKNFRQGKSSSGNEINTYN